MTLLERGSSSFINMSLEDYVVLQNLILLVGIVIYKYPSIFESTMLVEPGNVHYESAEELVEFEIKRRKKLSLCCLQ